MQTIKIFVQGLTVKGEVYGNNNKEKPNTKDTKYSPSTQSKRSGGLRVESNGGEKSIESSTHHICIDNRHTSSYALDMKYF